MATRGVRNVLSFLRDNVKNGLESIDDARSFVESIEGLTENEGLFLKLALHSRSELEAAYARYCRPVDGSRSGLRGPRQAAETR